MVRSTFFLRGVILAGSIAAAVAATAQPLLPLEAIDLGSLATFQATSPNWQIAGDIGGDPRTERTFAAIAGSGVLVNLPRDNAKGNLQTAWEHGDLELELEFLLPVRSNSGIYLQGRYEVQLLDSWGVDEPKAGDCGGIYPRWDPTRAEGQRAYDGHAPRANACRAPGLWQHLRVEFEAPRFNAAGEKIKPARFAKVVLNGFVIHENVELTGPTRGALADDERAAGPLLIQGDHGPVAFRAMKIKRFGAERVAVEQVRYKYYSGEFKQLGEYESSTPTREGTAEQFTTAAVETSGRFGLVFTGTLVVPTAGDYAFALESNSITRLSVGGRVVTIPLERNSAPGVITLAAGRHDFRVDLLHLSPSRPSLEVMVEGPGIAPHPITAPETTTNPSRNPRPIVLEPKERALVQRGFVPFEPRKKLYAVSVGTPAGVHYSYDTETGTLLRVWRGKFLDTTEMWEGRGYNQLAKPLAPALTFHDQPTFALIEYPLHSSWPNQPELLWTARGYELDADGLPVFTATLVDIQLRDRFAPTADGRGLTRTIETAGKLPSWSAWVLIADAEKIAPQPEGRGWIVGDREWYVDWPADAAVRPVLRTHRGRQILAVPLTRGNLEKPITYSIVW